MQIYEWRQIFKQPLHVRSENYSTVCIHRRSLWFTSPCLPQLHKWSTSPNRSLDYRASKIKQNDITKNLGLTAVVLKEHHKKREIQKKWVRPVFIRPTSSSCYFHSCNHLEVKYDIQLPWRTWLVVNAWLKTKGTWLKRTIEMCLLFTDVWARLN